MDNMTRANNASEIKQDETDRMKWTRPQLSLLGVADGTKKGTTPTETTTGGSPGAFGPS